MRTVPRFALVGLLVSMLVLPAGSAFAAPTTAGAPQATAGVAVVAADLGAATQRSRLPLAPPPFDICKILYNPHDPASMPAECRTAVQNKQIRTERELVEKCGDRNQQCLPKDVYDRLRAREKWYDKCGDGNDMKTSCMSEEQKAMLPPRADSCKLAYNPFDLPSMPPHCWTEEQRQAVIAEQNLVNKCGPRNRQCLPKEIYDRLREREKWYDRCGEEDEIKTSCMTEAQKAEEKIARTWESVCVYDRKGAFTGTDVHAKCQTADYKREQEVLEIYDEECLQATEGSGFEVDTCDGDESLPCSPSNKHLKCSKEDFEHCPTDDKPGFFDVGTRFLVGLGCAFRTATVGIHTQAAAMWAKDRSTKPCGEVDAADPCKPNPTSTFVWNVLFPFAVMVALGGIIWQGIILMITRRAEPLIDIFRGLITVSIWMSIGLAAPTIAMGAADEATWWVFDNFHEHKNTNWSVEVAAVRIPLDLISMLLALVLAYIVGMIQYVIMIFREATVIMLSGATVLAAAGNFTNATRQWLPKVLGWMVALIVYKPIAALTVMAGAVMYNTGTESFDDWLMGVMMLFLSIIALPALMKMFTWTTGSLQNTTGLQAGTGAMQTYALYGKAR